MSEEDMSSGSFEGSGEEKMKGECFEEMKGSKSENEGMKEDEKISDGSDGEEREYIKKCISNEKKELHFEGELSEEAFLYLLELLKQDSETLITSLSLRSKQQLTRTINLTHYRKQTRR